MTPPDLSSTVAVIRALGHPARLRALAMLRSGELCVCQITEVLKLATSTVSLHLRELKRCGLIRERKAGRWVHVRLTNDSATRKLLNTVMSMIGSDAQIEDDARLVRELRELPVEDLCRLGLEQARARARSDAAVRHAQEGSGGCE